MKTFQLPARPGCCAKIFFLSGPLCALGFLLAGCNGFLLVALVCTLFMLSLLLLHMLPPSQKRMKRR